MSNKQNEYLAVTKTFQSHKHNEAFFDSTKL